MSTCVNLGTTIELSDRVPSQNQAATSPVIPPNATTSPTITTNPSHWKRLQTWWSHTISLNLDFRAPGNEPRDYFALERTFLGWFRTSVALTSLGVVVTQLFILKDVDPLRGKIFGVVTACGAIAVNLLGCFRYFKQQRLLAQGKALSGGWHHQILIGILFAVLIALLVVVLVDG